MADLKDFAEQLVNLSVIDVNELANILLRITNFGFFTAIGDNFVAIISGKSA